MRLKAALELGRRLAALSPEERPPVGSPEDVANLLSIEMAAREGDQRTRLDRAAFVRDLVDVQRSDAERIVLVSD